MISNPNNFYFPCENLAKPTVNITSKTTQDKTITDDNADLNCKLLNEKNKINFFKNMKQSDVKKKRQQEKNNWIQYYTSNKIDHEENLQENNVSL